ncbi:hypothetical protein L208DRAFT_1396694 [Tricholoma matsutake]|nr:hypothetical protein L208DRAFT_1396694 [Tricholoma matsutake 945]
MSCGWQRVEVEKERSGCAKSARQPDKNKEETGDNIEPRYPGAPTVEAGQLNMKERRREETTPAISDATRKRTSAGQPDSQTAGQPDSRTVTARWILLTDIGIPRCGRTSITLSGMEKKSHGCFKCIDFLILTVENHGKYCYSFLDENSNDQYQGNDSFLFGYLSGFLCQCWLVFGNLFYHVAKIHHVACFITGQKFGFFGIEPR